MITVTFECGHSVQCDGTAVPSCSYCHTAAASVIARVEAPAPIFRGQCSGPHATFEELPAQPVTFTGAKDGSHG